MTVEMAGIALCDPHPGGAQKQAASASVPTRMQPSGLVHEPLQGAPRLPWRNPSPALMEEALLTFGYPLSPEAE